MSSTTEQRTSMTNKLQPDQIFEQFQKLTSLEQAQAKTTTYPMLITSQARVALKHLKDHVDPNLLVEIVEPLAEVIGWAEAQVYVTNQQGPRSFGAQVPTGNGSRN